MKAFRKLAKNIFFKIVLGLVALSFVAFGVAEFITGMPNSWVLKVGNKKIGLKAYQNAMELDKKIIRSAKGSSPEIENYLNSNKFNQDVSNRLVRRLLIEKISNEIGATGSKKLILKTVADDSNFKNSEGKFDHDKFKKFLANNGLDEDRYIQEVSNEISAEMIIGSIGLVSPVNFKTALEFEAFNQEKRIADTLYINKSAVKENFNPSEQEIEKFYSENKTKYLTPEYRDVSYLEIDTKLFEKNITASDEEINKYYQDNLSTAFTIPENKDMLHLSFEDEKSAQQFEAKIKSSTSEELKNNFIKFAKSDKQKKLEDITLKAITKNSLPEQISQELNSLKINELSKIIKSEIGFHLFVITNINPQSQIALNEAKGKIFDKIIAEKKSKFTQELATKINDELLIAKSIEEVASKYQLKTKNISAISLNESNKLANKNPEIKNLIDFSKNAIASKINQPSKLFQTQEPNKFYALEVKKITASYQPELAEVKNKIIEEIVDNLKIVALKDLVKKIHQEISANPSQAFAIASKYGLKFEKNKTYPRKLYIDLGNNGKMPYENQFLNDLFTTAIGKTTPLSENSQNEFVMAIVRNIKEAELSSQEVVNAKKTAVETFANDIMMEYNDYLQKKYPIEVNKKFFTQNS